MEAFWRREIINFFDRRENFFPPNEILNLNFGEKQKQFFEIKFN